MGDSGYGSGGLAPPLGGVPQLGWQGGRLQWDAGQAGKGLWAAGAASSSGAGAAAVPAEYIGNASSKKFQEGRGKG